MASKLECPKCKGFSWVEVEDEDTIVQRCVCGLRRYLEITKEGCLISRSPVKANNFTLPAKGTTLSKVLGCLVALGDLSSIDIATQMSISIDKATTNLSVLRRRGLIKMVRDRRGKSGGSLWTVYPPVRDKY